MLLISTKVGQSFLLSNDCIYDDKKELNKKSINLSYVATEYNFTGISSLFVEKHVRVYDNYFKGIL